MTSTLTELLDLRPPLSRARLRDRRSSRLYFRTHRRMAEMSRQLEEQTCQLAEIGRALGMLMELELARSERSPRPPSSRVRERPARDRGQGACICGAELVRAGVDPDGGHARQTGPAID
jgi:hypothetical protein